MIGINLPKSDEKVVGIIRELYIRDKRPVSTGQIYSMASNSGMQDYQVRQSLQRLSAMGLIFRKDLSWEPKLDIVQQQSMSPSVQFDDNKVMECIRHIGHPSKPNVILKKFIELYGIPDNVENFLRRMREHVEMGNGPFFRDEENNYWIKERTATPFKDTTLDKFMV